MARLEVGALGNLRQEDHQKFKAYLGHKARPCPKKQNEKVTGWELRTCAGTTLHRVLLVCLENRSVLWSLGCKWWILLLLVWLRYLGRFI